MELLDLVDGANGEARMRGECEALRVGARVERTHGGHVLQVDVREEQLAVLRVDHRGPVAACEHVELSARIRR